MKKAKTRTKPKRAASKPKRAQPKLRRRDIARPDGAMTPKEYLACLKELGLTTASQRTAKVIGSNIRQCQRYASGDAVVPEALARLLRMYIEHGLPDGHES